MTGPERGDADLGRSLEAAIRLLNGVTGREAPVSGPEESTAEEPVRGHGESGNGLVRAEVTGYGRLESLQLDPGLLRAGTEAIAEYVIEAVRAAQDDERQRRGAVAAGPDTAALQRQLEGVAAEAWRGFDRMLGDLDALTRRFDRR